MDISEATGSLKQPKRFQWDNKISKAYFIGANSGLLRDPITDEPINRLKLLFDSVKYPDQLEAHFSNYHGHIHKNNTVEAMRPPDSKNYPVERKQLC